MAESSIVADNDVILPYRFSSPNIIIAGDFNLPSIMWSDTGASITSSPAYGRELNSLFLEIIDDYGLEQLVYQPTRQGNILDSYNFNFRSIYDN